MIVINEECRKAALVRQQKAARIEHLLRHEHLSTDEIARRMQIAEDEVCGIIEQAGWM